MVRVATHNSVRLRESSSKGLQDVSRVFDFHTKSGESWEGKSLNKKFIVIFI